MRVKALYDHGRIELPVEVKLKHERFHVVVSVPDEEVVDSPKAKAERNNIGAELDEILGKYRQNNAPRTVAEDKSVWHQHLVEKHT